MRIKTLIRPLLCLISHACFVGIIIFAVRANKVQQPVVIEDTINQNEILMEEH